MQIRMAVVEDTKEILKIYKPYVEKTFISFEHTVPSEEEFSNRIRQTLEKYPYLVATDHDKIVGYTYAAPFKSRAAYEWTVETSIYVNEAYRGQGIGHQLYTALEALLIRQNIVTANACIAYPNEESIKFHESCGYQKVAHFTKCGYKLGKWVDMIWMEKRLRVPPKHPQNIIPIQQLQTLTLES